ncbi:MAG: gliding motility-associated C-terminal domain-containing protein [Bacteroidota bacterium]
MLFNTGALSETDTFYIIATNPTGCTDTVAVEAIINIGDVEPPAITCPDDQNIAITTQVCNLSVNELSPLFSDNCEVQSVTWRMDGATNGSSPATGENDLSGTSFNLGETEVWYIVSDVAGNQDSCQFSVELSDQAAPDISNQATNEIVECDGSGNQAAFDAWLNAQAGALADDACGAVSWTTNPANPQLSDDCGQTGTVMVSFIATDAAGNTSVTSASFTIEDTQAPQFTVPAGITIGVDEDPNDLSLVGNVTDEGDACDIRISDGGVVEASFTDVVVNNPCSDVITRTWMLADECGNETRQIQNIVMQHPSATASLSGGGVVCAGDSTDLVFEFSAGGLFDVVFSNGQQEFELFGVSHPHTEKIAPLSSGTYEIISVVDRARASCPVDVSGAAVVTVNNLVQVDGSSLSLTCDELNNNYQVSFRFVGGVPGGLSITDEAGNAIGDLVAGVFTSTAFTSGETYAILIDDGSSCEPIRIDGSFDCPCNSESGTLVADPIDVCGTGFPALSFNNDQVLDDNDVLEFLLHDGSTDAIGTIIASNSVPEFNFGAPMVFETTYYVTAVVGTEDTDGGVNLNDACASFSSGVPITFYEIPEVSIDQSDLIISCETNQLQLDGSGSTGGPNIRYLWTTPNGRILSGGGTANATVDQPGTYRLEVIDERIGCSTFTEVEVAPDADLPVVQIATPEVLTCDNIIAFLDGSASSSGSNFVYEWSVVSGGNILSGTDGASVEVDAAGVYQLSITDTDKNCTSAATIIVEENIQAPVAEAGDPALFSCVITEVTLNGQGSSTGENYQYEWRTADGQISTAGTTLSPTISSTGTYELIVTDLRNGCTASDQVVIPTNDDFPSNADLEIKAPRCAGQVNGSIAFNGVTGGQEPYQYSIDGENFGFNPYFNKLQPGDYSPTIIDANGCEWSTTVSIVEPEVFSVDLGADTIIQLGDSVLLEAMVNVTPDQIQSVRWNPDGDDPCINCLEQMVKPTNTTQYVVTVQNEMGCPGSDAIRVIVDKDKLVFIPTGFSPNDDQTNEVFYIHTGRGVRQINQLKVFNRWGGTVFTALDIPANDPTYGWDGTVNGQPLNPGIFVVYVEVEFEDGTVEVFKGDVSLIK